MTVNTVTLLFSRWVRSRYAVLFGIIVLILLYHTSYNGPSHSEGRPAPAVDKNRVLNVPNMAESCATTLASHVDILKTEYGALFAGIKHVAVIGFPGHS